MIDLICLPQLCKHSNSVLSPQQPLISLLKHFEYWESYSGSQVKGGRQTYNRYLKLSGNEDNKLVYPGEKNTKEEFLEGKSKTIIVNAYERNIKARNKCLDFYGLNCQVCEFNFEEKFGEIGKDFIHVHHIKEISQGMGLDQRIGDRFLRAGPAYGGSCFPKDTRAIINTAYKFKSNLSIIKSVIKSNDDRKKLLTDKVYKILNNNLKNKLITFLGVTFKPNTDDMREASSLYMIPKLLKKGANIKYFDPSGKKNEFKKFKRVKYCKNVTQACLKSDLIILHTEWNEFKTLNFKKLIKKNNFKIFDMRNLYSPKSMKKKNINYFGIGR